MEWKRSGREREGERERDGWREWVLVRSEAVQIRRRKEGRRKEKEKKERKMKRKKKKEKNIRIFWTFHIFFTLGEAVLPNIFVQNKPESEKSCFSIRARVRAVFSRAGAMPNGP